MGGGRWALDSVRIKRQGCNCGGTGSRQYNAHYLNYKYYSPSLIQHYFCRLISGNAFHFLLADGVNQGHYLVRARTGHNYFLGGQMAQIIKISWRFVQYSFFPSFFIIMISFNVLVGGIKDYCSSWSYWKIHTHTHAHARTIDRNPLDEGSACRRDLYPTTKILKTHRDFHLNPPSQRAKGRSPTP